MLIPRRTSQIFYLVLFLGIALMNVACSSILGGIQPTPPTGSPAPARVVTSLPPSTPTLRVTLTPTITPTPTMTATPTPDPSCAAGSLADTRVNRDLDLLYQPDGTSIGAPKVTKGRCVILFGKDDRKESTKRWFRVLWADYVGWVPADATDFAEKKLDSLRTPPPCARPRATSNGLASEWRSNYDGQVVVVIDLYRSRMGADYPLSTFQVKVNGAPIAGKDRMVSTRGQFLMRGTPLGTNVKQGDRIGFTLRTTSQDQVKLFATFFAVPSGCNFDDRQ